MMRPLLCPMKKVGGSGKDYLGECDKEHCVWWHFCSGDATAELKNEIEGVREELRNLSDAVWRKN